MTESRILVVEDEALIAMELEDRLTHLGYTVCGHTSRGEEVAENVTNCRPDLILMDINLADAMNGIEAAALLRQRQDIPVVFLSAFSDDDLIQQAALTEPYGYLIKPFDERELLSTITIALHRHKMDRQRSQLAYQLQEELNEKRQLCSILPLCARCNRQLCDENGQWMDFEAYIDQHPGARIAHGICPSCQSKEQEENKTPRDADSK